LKSHYNKPLVAGFFSAVAFAEGKWAVLATVAVTCRPTADCFSLRLLFAATSAALGPDFFSERLKNAFFQAPEPHSLHGHTGRFAMPNGPCRGAVCAVLRWRMGRFALPSAVFGTSFPGLHVAGVLIFSI
jgi:hypothetical protein